MSGCRGHGAMPDRREREALRQWKGEKEGIGMRGNGRGRGESGMGLRKDERVPAEGQRRTGSERRTRKWERQVVCG